jgi:RNA polymerase sigma factor (sigma-70 family)
MSTATPNNGFLSLIEEHKRIIFKICHAYCRDKSEHDDLAQEIVYELWRSFAKYDQRSKFSTWLYRIALNVAISYYRKKKKHRHIVPYEEHLIEVPEQEQDQLKDERFGLLQQFIQSLNEIDRSIMMLYLDEQPYRDIAAIIGISETNVATRIGRIKEKIKTRFSHTSNSSYGDQ